MHLPKVLLLGFAVLLFSPVLSQDHIGKVWSPRYGLYHSIEEFIWDNPSDTTTSISANHLNVYYKNDVFPPDRPPYAFAKGFTTCHMTFWYYKKGYYPVVLRGRYSVLRTKFDDSDAQLASKLDADAKDALTDRSLMVMDVADGTFTRLTTTRLLEIVADDEQLKAQVQSEVNLGSAKMLEYLDAYNEAHDDAFFASRK